MHFQHLSNYIKSPLALLQSASSALRFRFQALSGRNLLICSLCGNLHQEVYNKLNDVPIVQCADRGSDVTPVHHAIPAFRLTLGSVWDFGTQAQRPQGGKSPTLCGGTWWCNLDNDQLWQRALLRRIPSNYQLMPNMFCSCLPLLLAGF